MEKLEINLRIKSDFESLRSIFKLLKEWSLWEIKSEEWGNAILDMQLLIGALVMFSRNDAVELFNSQKDVNERAMAGCVYRYMYCAHILNFCKATYPNIDIEYDRIKIDQENFGPKVLSLCQNNSCEEELKKKCTQFIYRKKRCCLCGNCDKRVIPDLIIYKRNSDLGKGNGMIVEFKRYKVNDSVDNIKITYATCEFGALKYKLGAVVKLSKKFQKIKFYGKNYKNLVFQVDSNKVIFEKGQK